MSARFAAGTSLRSTRYVSSENAKTGNQGKGMRSGIPGYIRTSTDASTGGLKGAKAVAPRFTRGFNMASTSNTAQTNKSVGSFIGKSGKGQNEAAGFDTSKFRGSSDKSYRATSTGPAGRVVSSRNTGAENRGASEKEGAARGKPTRGSGIASSRGKMESLRGKVRFSAERR